MTQLHKAIVDVRHALGETLEKIILAQAVAIENSIQHPELNGWKNRVMDLYAEVATQGMLYSQEESHAR